MERWWHVRSVTSQNQACNDGFSSDGEEKKSKLIHLVLRVTIYCIGLVLLAAGIVVQTKSGLGVAALTCFATALAAVLQVTLGSMVFATYVIYVAIQAWITRKHFRPKILLELLFSAMMGGLVDLMSAWFVFSPSNMFQQVVLMLLGLAITAVGVSTVVGMDIVPNAPDGLVQSIADSLGKKFGSIKVVFDTSHVAASLMLSVCMLGNLAGFGLTTVVSALFLGHVINIVDLFLQKPLRGLAFGN